jgi:hypothetical protein
LLLFFETVKEKIKNKKKNSKTLGIKPKKKVPLNHLKNHQNARIKSHKRYKVALPFSVSNKGSLV